MTLAPEQTDRVGRLGLQLTLVPEETDRAEKPDELEFPAGWYDDPTVVTATWPSEMEQRATGLIVVGYVLAVLIPIFGFIIGLTQMSRNAHGVRIVWVAVAMLVLGVLTQAPIAVLIPVLVPCGAAIAIEWWRERTS